MLAQAQHRCFGERKNASMGLCFVHASFIIGRIYSADTAQEVHYQPETNNQSSTHTHQTSTVVFQILEEIAL